MTLTVTYRWDIPTCDVAPILEGHTDVVRTVNWLMVGSATVDGSDYEQSFCGSLDVAFDPDAPFVAYSDPDIYSTVVGWIEAAYADGEGPPPPGLLRITSMKADIEARIAAMITPPVVLMPGPTPPG